MPHGGGHHGGGGGGGGHHHRGGGGFGGGHHRHHHHHRYHHHRYHTGPDIYFSTGTWYYSYRRRPLSWVFVSIFITVAVVVCTSVTIRYTASHNYSANSAKLFSPTDTSILSISNSLCQGVYVENGDESDGGYTATLYMLSSRPELTGTEDFQFNYVPTFGGFSGYYEFYYYYLHPGSHFTMSACLLDNTASVTFYLFKGYKNFNNWRNDEDYDYVTIRTISDLCQTGNMTYSYHVKSTDFYYLVFKATASKLQPISLTASFHRTRYEIGNSSVVDQCSVESDNLFQSCSLSVPLSGHTAFLEISCDPDTPENWLDGVDVSTSCVPRIWMYVVISLCILVGVVALLASFVAFCIWKARRAQSSPANLATRPVTNRGEEPVAPLLANKEPSPPPTNPNYNPKESAHYGGMPAGGAPPPYQP